MEEKIVVCTMITTARMVGETKGKIVKCGNCGCHVWLSHTSIETMKENNVSEEEIKPLCLNCVIKTANFDTAKWLQPSESQIEEVLRILQQSKKN